MRSQLPLGLRAFVHEFSTAAKEGPRVFFLPISGAVDGTISAVRRWDGRLKGAIAVYIAPVIGAASAVRAWLNRVR